jgi:hypothetical protein
MDPKAQTPAAPAPSPRRDIWLTIQFTLMLLAGLAVLALGAYLAVNRQQYEVLALGFLAVIIPASIYTMVGGSGGGASADTGLAAEVAEQRRLLAQISDRLLISDRAKRIAFRQRDRDALRDAIVEDMRTEDYDQAMALVNEMADTYGYREEAEEFRGKIMEAQRKQREAMVQRLLARIDEITRRRDWELARHEAMRLIRTYPDYPEFKDLLNRVEQSFQTTKHELERQFLQAAERGDVDRAVELMKELDKYLTSEEAAAYMETARGVVGRQRENLGVRFKMAVQDRDWVQAIAIGEQIMRDFPNTKFATEVRGMLDTLRQRANEQRAAAAGTAQAASK